MTASTIEQTTRRAVRPAPGRPRAGRRHDRTFDRAYWLEHSQGYRVEAAGGRVGFVDEVRVEDGDTLLAVRAGMLGRRILVFRASDVDFVVPRAQRIYLASAAAPISTEPRR